MMEITLTKAKVVITSQIEVFNNIFHVGMVIIIVVITSQIEVFNNITFISYIRHISCNNLSNRGLQQLLRFTYMTYDVVITSQIEVFNNLCL